MFAYIQIVLDYTLGTISHNYLLSVDSRLTKLCIAPMSAQNKVWRDKNLKNAKRYSNFFYQGVPKNLNHRLKII